MSVSHGIPREPKHYMNMSRNNNNQKSKMMWSCEYKQYTEREPESIRHDYLNA